MNADTGKSWGGFLVRSIAMWIDILAITFCLYLLLFPLQLLTNPLQEGTFLWKLSGAVFVPFILFSPIFYSTLLESSAISGTAGKYLMSLEIVDEEGDPISVKKALIRNLIKYFCIYLPFPFVLLFLLIFFDSRNRGVHDMITGTFVVEKK